ncbi:lymphocyte antigen 75 isoform X1 [Lepeophtheirus salmonis]|uniref:lymphocyte antigen 75 isoform X1 n=1 Tax=Lepeophtheirus salmonis TaxID=72036 RepID=UPI003AF33E86
MRREMLLRLYIFHFLIGMGSFQYNIFKYNGKKIYKLESIKGIPMGGFKGIDSRRVRCPKGWISSYLQCFQFQTEFKNFNDANDHCGKVHPRATLANIYDKETNNLITGLLNNYKVFIGVKVVGKEPQWLNKLNLTYYNNTNYSFDSKRLCLIIDSDGLWKGANCSFPRSYLCSFDKFTCPPGYYHSDLSCVKPIPFYGNIQNFDYILTDFCPQDHPNSRLGTSQRKRSLEMFDSFFYWNREEKNEAVTLGPANYLKSLDYYYDPFNSIYYSNAPANQIFFLTLNDTHFPGYFRFRIKYLVNIMCEQPQEEFHGNCGSKDWIEDFESGNCYLNVEEDKDWNSAEKHCISLGKTTKEEVHLVSIPDPRMQFYIETLWRGDTLTREFPELWIGLQKNRNIPLGWSDGTPASYLYLRKEQEYGCAAMDLFNQYGLWYFTDCKKKKYFICQKKGKYAHERDKEINMSEDELSPILDVCPFGWKRFKRQCFIFRRKSATYASSEKHCKALDKNAHIAYVDDEESREFIGSQIDVSTFIHKNSPLYYQTAEHLCSVLIPPGIFQSLPCKLVKPYVCSRPIGDCSHILIGGICYSISKELKTCKEASASCHHMLNGDIASIHKIEVNEYFSTLAKNLPSSKLMIGLTKTSEWHDKTDFDYNNNHMPSFSKCKTLTYGGELD